MEDNQRQFMTRIFPMMARIRTADEAIVMMQAGAREQAG